MKRWSRRVLAGVCAVGLSALAGPESASATDRMYWTNLKVDAIQRANLDGTGVETVVGGVVSLGLAIEPAAGDLYWTDLGNPDVGGDETIRRANLDGSSIEVLVGVAQGLSHPVEIGIDPAGGKMYWTDAGLGAGIFRANLDGTSIEKIVDVIALRSPDFGTGPGQTLEFASVWGLTLDLPSGRLYWTDFFAGDIHSANLDGTNVGMALVEGLDLPRGIALDGPDGRMYWTEAAVGAGRIQRADLAGANLQLLLAAPAAALDGPFDIALDLAAGSMYWTDMESGLIQRAGLDGSNPKTLVVLEFFDAGKNRFRPESPTSIALELTPPPGPCTNGLDDDGDGLVDFPDDPGCRNAGWVSESPECDDGLDNDGDGWFDHPADPNCKARWDNREANARCGLLGIEGMLVPVLARAIRRRRTRR